MVFRSSSRLRERLNGERLRSGEPMSTDGGEYCMEPIDGSGAPAICIGPDGGGGAPGGKLSLLLLGGDSCAMVSSSMSMLEFGVPLLMGVTGNGSGTNGGSELTTGAGGAEGVSGGANGGNNS